MHAAERQAATSHPNPPPQEGRGQAGRIERLGPNTGRGTPSPLEGEGWGGGAAQALIALFCALALTPNAAQAAAAAKSERGRVLLIVDSTAYMGTLLGGSSKMVAVGNALASVWPNHAGQLDLGLTVYGHRISGQPACTDIDPRRRVTPLAADAAGDLLTGLKTKGDAGVAKVLAAVAASKDAAVAGGSIILVAGGPDSCEADPCEAASKIAAERQLPVHVIAIDAGGEAASLQSLKCVADNTKGHYWQVASTLELAAALDDALALTHQQDNPAAGLRAGSADAGADPAASGLAGAGAPDPSAEALLTGNLNSPAPNAPPGQVSLSALLTDAGPVLTSGVSWRVYAASGQTLKKVMASNEPSPVLTLPSGEYLINAAYGRSYATRKVKVAEGSGKAELVLNAGGVKLGARLGDGSLVPAQFVTADILSDERDQFGNRAKLAEAIRPGVVLRLNSGLYHVSATYGDANATVQSDVAVEAGRITDAIVTFTVARVTFRLVQQPGGEALTGTTWTILGGAGETVKKSVAALPTHILAPGDYSVAAERAGRQYTQTFTIKTGDAIQVEVVAKE